MAGIVGKTLWKDPVERPCGKTCDHQWPGKKDSAERKNHGTAQTLSRAHSRGQTSLAGTNRGPQWMNGPGDGQRWTSSLDKSRRGRQVVPVSPAACAGVIDVCVWCVCGVLVSPVYTVPVLNTQYYTPLLPLYTAVRCTSTGVLYLCIRTCVRFHFRFTQREADM